MLADAEEMPPERVWNGIVASMGAEAYGVAKRSRVRALWLSGLGLVSAAAAIAATAAVIVAGAAFILQQFYLAGVRGFFACRIKGKVYSLPGGAVF